MKTLKYEHPDLERRSTTRQTVIYAGRRTGLIARALGVLAFAAAAVVAFLLSALLFSILFAFGAALFAYAWWVTRHARRQLREAQPRIYEAEKSDQSTLRPR